MTFLITQDNDFNVRKQISEALTALEAAIGANWPPQYVTKSANFTAADGEAYNIDTSSVACTLPSTFAKSDRFDVVVGYGLTGCTVKVPVTGSSDPYGDAVAADTPYRWYRLAEPSGSTMADSSGSAADGSYHGSVTLGVTGMAPGSATCATFGAAGEYAASPILSSPTDLTIEAVFKTSNMSGVSMTIAGYHSGNTGDAADDAGGQDRVLYLGTDGKPRFYCYFSGGSGALVIAGSTDLRDGAPHLGEGRVDDTAKVMKLYIDGAEVASTSYTGTPYNYGATGPYLIIGRGQYSATGFTGGNLSYFVGEIQHVAVYTSPLSAARVTAHNNALTTGLSYATKLDGGTATKNFTAPQHVSFTYIDTTTGWLSDPQL